MPEKSTFSAYQVTDFRNKTGPIIDVRSPSEFFKGHWPGAVNIPLFSDLEREQIGKSYKKEGRLNAILKGLKITLPKTEKLQDSFSRLVSKENESKNSLRIYCWRGGMRSATFAWLARSIGIKTFLLKDGYKSYRKWALNQFEKNLPIRLLGGKTGTGKTDILESINSGKIFPINLEQLANHRGSSFGSLGMKEQPSSQHFENLIAEHLYRFSKSKALEIWIEAESSNLGKCRIPKGLYTQMTKAPVLEITKTKEERINNLVNVYSQNSQNELKDCVSRISKRLGPQRTSDALNAIERKEWSKACIAMLDYYDRCYDYELKKSVRINSIDISGLDLKLAIKKILSKKVEPL